MIGLVIDKQRLERVIERQTMRAEAIERHGGEDAPTMRVVTPEVLAATAERYPSCQCEKPGIGTSVQPRPALEAGMLASQLSELGEGCTGSRESVGGGHVCERLNAVRRTYGH